MREWLHRASQSRQPARSRAGTRTAGPLVYAIV